MAILVGLASVACGDNADDTGPPRATLVRTDLVSDRADAQLINAWGLSFEPSPVEEATFWVSAEGSGVVTSYTAEGVPGPVVVTMPSATEGRTGAPTGQLYNETPRFDGDRRIFVTSDGLIAGWQAETSAVTRYDNSATDASYTGVGYVTEGEPFLLAANFRAGVVDVFDGMYLPTTEIKFEDPLPLEGYAPFNVAVLSDRVYVAYAKHGADDAEEMTGSGLGYVNRFEADGTFGKRLIEQGGMLNAPWGLALAPNAFAPAPGALIVGNFGDGRLHAYDPNSGQLVAEVTDEGGEPLAIDGLWALTFGPKKDAEDSSPRLFFTAGPEKEAHGVFGVLDAR